jgi:ribosomal protein L37E
METKHTPGPWAWYTGGNHKALVRPGVDGRILMQRDVDGELIYEDACLIAAAPDLLAALDAVLKANPPAGRDDRAARRHGAGSGCGQKGQGGLTVTTDNHLTCTRCLSRWWPRSPARPKRCPRCGSPYWDRARVYEWPEKRRAKCRTKNNPK